MKQLLTLLLLTLLMTSCKHWVSQRYSTTGVVTTMKRYNAVCYGGVTFQKSNERNGDREVVWYELPCAYNVGDTLVLTPVVVSGNIKASSQKLGKN